MDKHVKGQKNQNGMSTLKGGEDKHLSQMMDLKNWLILKSAQTVLKPLRDCVPAKKLKQFSKLSSAAKQTKERKIIHS